MLIVMPLIPAACLKIGYAKPNRSIIILLAALCIVFFSVLIIPNAKAS